MKKPYFLTLLLSLISMVLFAQDTAVFKALYQFKHIEDTLHRSQFSQQEMVLYMGEKGTLFRNIQDEESFLLLHIAKGGTEKSFQILEECPSLVIQNQQCVDTKRIIDNKYQITEREPVQDWKLEDETKIIKGYQVQKASTTFRGRHYSAWFSPEIPLNFGPWKLRGLPGLILEASDDKKEVQFSFEGFEKINLPHPIQIDIPKNYSIKQVNQQQYIKIRNTFLNDPVGFMSGTLGVDASHISEEKTSSQHYNNPLEIN